MSKKIRILILTNQLLTTCGVSKHLLYFLSNLNNRDDIEFTIVCGGGDAVEKYQNICSEVIVYPVINHENRSVFNFLKTVYFLSILTYKKKINIIHSHNHYASNIAQFVAKFARIKTVQTVHGIIDPVGRLKHYPSEYFIAVNEHVKDYLIDFEKKSTSKVKLIRYGILQYEKDINKSTDKLIVIAAGRLISLKGFDVYIKAIAKLSPKNRLKTRFHLAGKGDCKVELINLAEQLGVELIDLGEVSDLISYFNYTNILVNPSRSENEGFPLTIIEAALAKNLIISSNFKGHDSLLKNNINSFIFNKNDIQTLANKLEYAIENYESLNVIIENCHTDFSKEFNIHRMITKTLTYYKEIQGWKLQS